MMLYEKPQAETIRFEKDNVFMTESLELDYSTSEAALTNACSGFSGSTNNFSCSIFGGYSAANPPSQGAQVTIGNGAYTYIYDYVGNHWKEHHGNGHH